MTTAAKLAIGAVVIASATGYMAYLGAASSWQYYVNVDECLAGGDAVASGRLRVSGKVVPGSLRIAENRCRADLSLEGSAADLPVCCLSPVPDNLADGMDVVVEGRLAESGVFEADKILTRCASKYESARPDVQPDRAGAVPTKGSL